MDIIKQFVDRKLFPHLLLCGKPLSGKTVAAEYYAQNAFQGRVYRIDAALEGGIDVFRDKIHQLSKQKQELTVCIIDNSDLLSMPCQQALRRVMEKQSHLVRFVFCVLEDPHVLMYPIQSRCVFVPFP